MAPSGISLNKPATLAILTLLAGGIILYRWRSSSSQANEAAISDDEVADGSGKKKSGGEEDDQSIKLVEELISVSVHNQKLEIWTQRAKAVGAAPGGMLVLFLHGQAFTSEVWAVKTETLQQVASWGYDAIAIDLPGYGKSKAELTETTPEQFLSALIVVLNTSPVVVSPSMSGSFSLPYLFSDGAPATRHAQGLVAIAPIHADHFDKNYKQDSLPTLIVYGENDPAGKISGEHLKALPRSQVVEIPKAGHACYVDQPDSFHKALKEFLDELGKVQTN